ncbi:MAG: hypothetical protein ACHQF2_03780 [Flavobacteriales bacterium]
MKTKYFIINLAALMLLTNCNKEKKLMKTLEGNWSIETSEKSYINQGGTEEVYETVSNAGKLIISEGPSKEIKQYDFFFVGANNDTMKSINQLVTDEFNRRLVMLNGYTDSLGSRNLVWTIEKERKNKQVWAVYGVDSTYFYPANNLNPGAASNWAVWRITLKRD